MIVESFERGQPKSGKTKGTLRIQGDRRFFTVWPFDDGNFPAFLQPGTNIEGEITPRDYQNKTYYTMSKIKFVQSNDDFRSTTIQEKATAAAQADKHDMMALSYAKDLAMSIVTKEATTQDAMLGRVRFFYNGLQDILLGEDEPEEPGPFDD